MSNNIDLDKGVNNTMNTLNFLWTAEFSNGVISQFDENGMEHKFQEVKDRMNELEFFHLYNKKNDKWFAVDLRKGFIKFNDAAEPQEIEKKDNIRLIYYRRVNGLTDFKKIVCEVSYFLGFQYNDEEGRNKKVLLHIFNDGSFIIE